MNQLERAVLAAAEGGAPAKTWQVPETAVVEFGDRHPLDGAVITAWSSR